MINATDAARYEIKAHGDQYTVFADGIEFSSPLPLGTAADLIRRAINADHFGDIDWTPLANSINTDIVTMCMEQPVDPDHVCGVPTHICNESAELEGWRQYISDGIGDTDGYFAPLDFEMWRAGYHRSIGYTEPRTAACTPAQCNAPYHEKIKTICLTRAEQRAQRRKALSVCRECYNSRTPVSA